MSAFGGSNACEHMIYTVGNIEKVDKNMRNASTNY